VFEKPPQATTPLSLCLPSLHFISHFAMCTSPQRSITQKLVHCCFAIPRGFPIFDASHQRKRSPKNAVAGCSARRPSPPTPLSVTVGTSTVQLNGAPAAAETLLASRCVCPDARCCSALWPQPPRPAPSRPKQHRRPYPTQRVGVFLFSDTRRNASCRISSRKLPMVEMETPGAGTKPHSSFRSALSVVNCQDGQRCPLGIQ
jgi:hypothetical protein